MFNSIQIINKYFRAGSIKNKKGFSLIECVIALLLVMVMGLAITSVFFFSSRNSANARKRIGALRLAQQRIEDVRTKNFSNLTAGTTTEYGVVFEQQKYNVELKITDSDLVTTTTAPGPETKLITYTVTPINNSLIGEAVTLTTVRAATRPGPNREENTP
jgi:type II secretory pathway pseudopilin PulG